MAAIIISIVLIIEIIFAVYCIKLRSNLLKIKNFIHIGMFAAFIFFTLLSVIKWSLRWYGLALLLFIWAVFAIISLLHGKKIEKEYKQAHVIRKAILSFLLVVIVTIPAIVFPQYKPMKTTGEYKVETVSYTYGRKTFGKLHKYGRKKTSDSRILVSTKYQRRIPHCIIHAWFIRYCHE